MKSISDLVRDIIRYKLSSPSLSIIRAHYNSANGCGSKTGIKVPKTMWLVDIESTCYIHDVRWETACSYEELVEANEEFDNNLKLICDAESNSFTIWFRRMRIAKYVSAVELKGLPEYAKIRGFYEG